MDENPYKPTNTVKGTSSDESKYSVLKKVLIGLGIAMLLVILLFVWIGFKTASTYNKLEGKAEELISKVLNEQSPWDFDTLKPNLSKLWIENVSEEQNEKLIKLYSKLGNFNSIEELNWQRCTTNSSTEHGTIDRCDYVALAKYENGDAQVLAGIVIEDGAPKIIQIHINSDAFFE